MKACQEKTISLKHTEKLPKVQQLESVVKRLGNPISIALLDLPCCLFSLPHVDGIIGYWLCEDCAIVVGDPICLPQFIPELTRAFHIFCQKYNWKIVYFLASDSFAHWIIHNGCQTLIHVGEQLTVDPTHFQKTQKIRWKIKQSLSHNVEIKEYQHFDPLLEKKMKDTIDTWLNSKHGPQIHLGKISIFFDPNKKRIFYAIQNDKVVGLLAISKLERYAGWTINFFLTIDPTIGITEHLMTYAFDTLNKENCHFLCLGIASGSQLKEIVGLNKFSKFFAHLIFKISRWLFHLETRKTYLNKYHPQSSPTYILTTGKLTLNELLAIKKLLNVKL